LLANIDNGGSVIQWETRLLTTLIGELLYTYLGMGVIITFSFRPIIAKVLLTSRLENDLKNILRSFVNASHVGK
jgi:hypothetical protein